MYSSSANNLITV